MRADLEERKARWKEQKAKEKIVVNDEDIAYIVSKWTGIPLYQIEEEESSKLLRMETELQKRVIDACVQLHGGYGYMLEYPIARAYADARVTTIYGGTTEIMKEIIGRSLGF